MPRRTRSSAANRVAKDASVPGRHVPAWSSAPPSQPDRFRRPASRSAFPSLALALVALSLTGCSGAEAFDPDTARHYVRYERDGSVSWGRLDGETVHAVDAAPWSGGVETGSTVTVADVRLLAPVAPSKVFAVGLNYRSHLGGGEPASEPPIFLKLPTSITGHEQPIVLPEGAENVHYEAELVLVIGKRLKDAPPEEAADAIFGVTCGNDVSGRNWQRADLQWFRAKASDTFGPVGPTVAAGVNPDDLVLRGRHNGEVVQEQTTSDLLFGSAAIVSFVSRYATIEAGDVIFTGTPGTTAALEPGDTFEVEIEGVCNLRNPVETGARGVATPGAPAPPSRGRG